jgi:hypothetical protein
MKDFFLLARGEFFQVFIEESQHLMAAAPSIRAEKGIFQFFLPLSAS